MKLSDFGLCKPLDCSALSTVPEEESSEGNPRRHGDIDGPSQFSRPHWTQQEQLQHWKQNRRTLVRVYLVFYRQYAVEIDKFSHTIDIHIVLLYCLPYFRFV